MNCPIRSNFTQCGNYRRDDPPKLKVKQVPGQRYTSRARTNWAAYGRNVKTCAGMLPYRVDETENPDALTGGSASGSLSVEALCSAVVCVSKVFGFR